MGRRKRNKNNNAQKEDTTTSQNTKMYRLPCQTLLVALGLGMMLLGGDERILKSLQWDRLTGGLISTSSNKNGASSNNNLRSMTTTTVEDWSSWINTTGITLSQIHGDPTKCKDVIYTGDTRLPFSNINPDDSYVHDSWEGLSYLVQTVPIFNQTCLVFFKIATPFIQQEQENNNNKQTTTPMHPVWGRLPATALVFQKFPKANYFLYMDTDAVLSTPDQTPTSMYQALSYDGYGVNATFQHKQPGLIVNKPNRGWLCMECQKYGLGHGCFNSGVLLWKRSKAARSVVKIWWESRLTNQTHNFFDKEGEPFNGWSFSYDEGPGIGTKMGEQNRLMYIYHTNPEAKEAIWPVPQQPSDEFQSSCPDGTVGHVPCLQNDNEWNPKWNESDTSSIPSCFINHYADYKKEIRKVKDLILGKIKTAKFGSSTDDGGEDEKTATLAVDKESSAAADSDWSWIDTSGISLHSVVGDQMKCTNVIYTGDTRLPIKTKSADDAFIHANWEGLSHIIGSSPALSETCLVFFQISDPFNVQGKELHSVWGRLPATAMIFSSFPNAQYFLYMDSDATLAFPDHTPEAMYQTLSYDGYGENATNQHLHPALIVNKPLTGWLCGNCETFGLGHGCINSGALLWHRSAAAKFILKTWWESRLYNQTQNFFHNGEPFHGWGSEDNNWNLGDKMGEQNRLMYIYGSNPKIHDVIWIVPRQISDEFKSTSCANAVDEGHMPCLQNDWVHGPKWKTTEPSCFINHYPDDKNTLVQTLELIPSDGQIKDDGDDGQQEEE